MHPKTSELFKSFAEGTVRLTHSQPFCAVSEHTVCNSPDADADALPTQISQT